MSSGYEKRERERECVCVCAQMCVKRGRVTRASENAFVERKNVESVARTATSFNAKRTVGMTDRPSQNPREKEILHRGERDRKRERDSASEREKEREREAR